MFFEMHLSVLSVKSVVKNPRFPRLTTDHTDGHGWKKGEEECFFKMHLSVPIRVIRGKKIPCLSVVPFNSS